MLGEIASTLNEILNLTAGSEGASGIIDKLLRVRVKTGASEEDNEAHRDALEPHLWRWDLMIIKYIPRKEDRKLTDSV